MFFCIIFYIFGYNYLENKKERKRVKNIEVLYTEKILYYNKNYSIIFVAVVYNL